MINTFLFYFFNGTVIKKLMYIYIYKRVNIYFYFLFNNFLISNTTEYNIEQLQLYLNVIK